MPTPPRTPSIPRTPHTPHTPRTGVLFVCLGNICRSPLAKALLLHHARARGVLDRLDVDSCGTGAWHVGRGADPRTVRTLARYGVPIVHTARQVQPAGDFERFAHLVAMDRSNAHALISLGAPPGRVRLMRSFDPAMHARPDHELDVPDPYTGGDDGFDEVYHMLDAACAGLLRVLTDPA